MLVFFCIIKTTYSTFPQINADNNNNKRFLFIKENKTAKKGVNDALRMYRP
jgi:hypothetical protein